MTAPEAADGVLELLDELVSYLPQRYPTLFKRTTTGISNLLTGETFDTTTLPLPQDPLVTCSRLIQDDIALIDKFGQALSEIHTSGSVPQFQTKLERGMVNFFRRLKPSNPILRNNYFLQVDEDIAWSRSIGEEDDAHVSWATAEKDKAVEHHWFRSERQSLRR
ncbi:hypothetical protein RJZ56_003276 [Blastomyces dermatitidis]